VTDLPSYPAGVVPHVPYDVVRLPQCNGPMAAVGSWLQAVWPDANPARHTKMDAVLSP